MAKRKTKFTKQLLQDVVSNSFTVSDCLRKLGLVVQGGNHRMINSYIAFYNIDNSHFNGKHWARGLAKQTSDTTPFESTKKAIPDELLFSTNYSPTNRLIRKRVKELGWEEKCQICGLQEWQGKQITLDLDHINGNPSDNRKDNLRFLCPNCHRQTLTWGNKKRTIEFKTQFTESLQETPKVKPSWVIKVPQFCIDCKKVELTDKAIRCVECFYFSQRKIKWPSKEEMTKMVWERPVTKIAEILLVSDKAIEKFCKKNNIEKPGRGYWAKVQARKPIQ